MQLDEPKIGCFFPLLNKQSSSCWGSRVIPHKSILKPQLAFQICSSLSFSRLTSNHSSLFWGTIGFVLGGLQFPPSRRLVLSSCQRSDRHCPLSPPAVVKGATTDSQWSSSGGDRTCLCRKWEQRTGRDNVEAAGSTFFFSRCYCAHQLYSHPPPLPVIIPSIPIIMFSPATLHCTKNCFCPPSLLCYYYFSVLTFFRSASDQSYLDRLKIPEITSLFVVKGKTWGEKKCPPLNM